MSPDPTRAQEPTVITEAMYASLAEYERELDDIWPDWRMKVPFSHLPYDHRARIKWLLKRHSLLMQGHDWPVIIVQSRARPDKCFTHPIPPDNGNVPPIIREPPRVTRYGGPKTPQDVPRPLSAPAIALRLGRPLEAVEAALLTLPAGREPLDWCRERLTPPALPGRESVGGAP